MADQPTSPTPPADANAQQQLDLALRLLTLTYRCDYEQLRLLPNRLPDDLPFALPLPEGARILGALNLAQSDDPEQPDLPGRLAPLAIILVETPYYPVEQGAQRLSAALEAQGWTQNVMPQHMRGGFAHVVPNYNFMRFGSAANDYILSISPAPSASAQITTFSISVNQETSAPPQRRIDYREQRESIPALFPPPGATQQGGGGSGGNGRSWVTATLSTDHSVTEVMANYDRQLESGGWRRRSGGSSDSVGWSFWAFNDIEGAEGRGALAVLGDPGHPRDYLALIQIETDAGGNGFAHWQSHSILKG